MTEMVRDKEFIEVLKSIKFYEVSAAQIEKLNAILLPTPKLVSKYLPVAGILCDWVNSIKAQI